MAHELTVNRRKQQGGVVLDFQAAWRRRHFPTAEEALPRVRTQIAVALQAFQGLERWRATGYRPWALCRFLRTPTPPVHEPLRSTAVVLLLDSLLDNLCLTVTGVQRWHSGEFLATQLTAHVVHAPAGPLTVTLVPYHGKPVALELTGEAGALTILRMHLTWRGWAVEQQTRRWA